MQKRNKEVMKERFLTRSPGGGFSTEAAAHQSQVRGAPSLTFLLEGKIVLLNLPTLKTEFRFHISERCKTAVSHKRPFIHSILVFRDEGKRRRGSFVVTETF